MIAGRGFVVKLVGVVDYGLVVQRVKLPEPL